ncbi:hypothetical protein PGT21_020837 [Puccinia graminis f. sp. tritici]|uniref:Uncharacterized protein n=1 Tax=Puccinia graminis f. sp. tritici TaxID=56615 RepID=A0A5B0MLQ0_PUCGR|nr:hypothetical protein PGT21_020837 [Puccinia graminis f. sp. tritici]
MTEHTNSTQDSLQPTVPAATNQNISELTRTKLAGELILPLNQPRRGPCLRKLVHWSNLLSALTTPGTIEGPGEQEQEEPVDPQAHSTNQPESEDRRRSRTLELESRSTETSGSSGSSTREQAEYDWFEHLMEEIDDSDSESESSDGAPDPQQAYLSEPGLIYQSSLQPSGEPPDSRGRSERKRTYLGGEASDSEREVRRRRLLLRSTHDRPRRARPTRPRRRRDSSTLGLPHWGFLCVRPTEPKTDDQEIVEDGHLPSLVPIKARYRFESLPLPTPPPSSSSLLPYLLPTPHPPLAPHHQLMLPCSPSLEAIDFNSYDFIIAATAHLDGQTILLKYLVGPARPGPSSSSPSSSSFLDSINSDHLLHLHPHLDRGHSQEQQLESTNDHRDHLRTHNRSATTRRQSRALPGLLVTKLQIVFNHLSSSSSSSSLPSEEEDDQSMPANLLGPPLHDHHHHLELHQDHADRIAHPPHHHHPHHHLLWKVFPLANPLRSCNLLIP